MNAIYGFLLSRPVSGEEQLKLRLLGFLFAITVFFYSLPECFFLMHSLYIIFTILQGGVFVPCMAIDDTNGYIYLNICQQQE